MDWDTSGHGGPTEDQRGSDGGRRVEETDGTTSGKAEDEARWRRGAVSAVSESSVSPEFKASWTRTGRE